MLVKFDAHWFQSYCQAVLTGDRELTRQYLPEAYRSIYEALRSPNLSQDEYQTLREALRCLDLRKH